MPRFVVPFAAAGLSAAALALGGPTAVQAAGPTGCATHFGLNVTSEQHIGPGHHSFTDSIDNCAVFTDPSQTVELTNSDNNAFLISGLNNTVNDFRNSNGNTIGFETSTDNTLSATGANGNGVTFNVNDMGDTITLLGTTNDIIDIAGSGLFADVVDANSGGNSCTIDSANAGTGTRTNPALVIC